MIPLVLLLLSSVVVFVGIGLAAMFAMRANERRLENESRGVIQRRVDDSMRSGVTGSYERTV